MFTVQKSPFMFYVYIAFPCYFWQQFLVQIIPAVIAFKVQDKRMEGLYLRVLFNGGMTIRSAPGHGGRSSLHRCLYLLMALVISGSLYP
jgi:hypothetical protein